MMTDKFVEAMAEQIALVGTGAPDDYSWPGDFNEADVEDCRACARAAFTAAKAKIEGTELAKRLRKSRPQGRRYKLTGEAADALDLLTAERDGLRALLEEVEGWKDWAVKFAALSQAHMAGAEASREGHALILQAKNIHAEFKRALTALEKEPSDET